MSVNKHPDRPLGSRASSNRRPDFLGWEQTGGASIGDGLKTSARIAGATTLFGLVLNSGPMLLASLAGILFLARGCIVSWTTTPTPQVPRPSALAAAPYVQPTYNNSPRLPIAPYDGSAARQRQSIPASDYAPATARAENIHQALQEDTDHSNSNPSPMDAQQLPGMFANPNGGYGQPTSWSVGFGGFSNPMLDVVAASPRENDAASLVNSPLFNFQRGRKFAGTSQMPGEASRRILLAISAIRDGGTNISAKLSTLDGARFTRAFTGMIEKDSWRLKLIPVRHPTSFGTFLTYMPWYSNSPTDITLEISADGKSLTGSSVASEQFELLPQFDINPDNVADARPTPSDDSALDDEEEGPTRWKLVRRNSEAIEDTETQYWAFESNDPGSGKFAWLKGVNTLASGTYAEREVPGHVDLSVMINGSLQVFQTLMDRPGTTGSAIRFCVPRTPDEKRPARLAEKYGNVYELTRMDTVEEKP